MQTSKKAFTMIELIFVIVILGILAAAVVPKLVATRDDAEVSKLATAIMTGAGEIASYATSKGETSNDFSVMSTSLGGLINNGTGIVNQAEKSIAVIAGSISDCVSLDIDTGAFDENLSIEFGNAGTDSLCRSLQSTIDAKKYPMQLRGTLVTR